MTALWKKHRSGGWRKPLENITNDKKRWGLQMQSSTLLFLLHVHGKLDELVGELGLLEDFLGDVSAGFDDDNAVVHLDGAGCLLAKQETAMAFLRCLVSRLFLEGLNTFNNKDDRKNCHCKRKYELEIIAPYCLAGTYNAELLEDGLNK